MLDGFKQRMIETSDATIRTRFGGHGPPLLLLHGYPQTHVMWYKIAPQLAEEFTVIMIDLRGYGESSKPATDASHFPFSKRAMARDQVEVMRTIGFDHFFVAGHDRGGRCGYCMALDFPEIVLKLAVLDIIPTSEALGRADMTLSISHWHWFFMAQASDLPERLIGSDPEYFWHWLTRQGVDQADPFAPQATQAYLRCFCNPDTIAATCEDDRAGVSIDITHDREDQKRGRRINSPLLALWGAKGPLNKRYDVPAVWRDWATDVRGHALDCGHYLAEEQPQETLAALRTFFQS